jgi:hypothetical protein
MKKTLIMTMIMALTVGLANAQEKTADEIARELANPATPMSSIGNHLEYRAYKGDLPGASSQESLTYSLQPSFPFNMGDGKIIALRPALPIIFDQPVFDADKGGFDKESGLGDISFDFVYGKTHPSGWVTLGGLFGVLPTASDDALGKDQWMLGPELVVAKINEWGVLGVLVFHSSDVAGEDDYNTNLTSIQYIYNFNLGGGYQFTSSPTITYDWEADSDQAWTVPLGVGLAKTTIRGKMPIKMQLQAFYNIEEPDAFAQDWGMKVSISPVVPNPFAR